jgi:hypothetical protein
VVGWQPVPPRGPCRAGRGDRAARRAGRGWWAEVRAHMSFARIQNTCEPGPPAAASQRTNCFAMIFSSHSAHFQYFLQHFFSSSFTPTARASLRSRRSQSCIQFRCFLRLDVFLQPRPPRVSWSCLESVQDFFFFFFLCFFLILYFLTTSHPLHYYKHIFFYYMYHAGSV